MDDLEDEYAKYLAENELDNTALSESINKIELEYSMLEEKISKDELEYSFHKSLSENNNLPNDVIKKVKNENDENENFSDDELMIGETYTDYCPSKLNIGKQHPDPVVESASLASVESKDVFYKLSLPAELISEGKLSSLQLETIVYASQAHSNYLPDKKTRVGFLIGDGAGVGKGRTIAGIILENFVQKPRNSKAVWVSVSNDVMEDSIRDLRDINADFIQVKALKEFSYGCPLEFPKYGNKKCVLFSTYATLISKSRTKKSKFSNRIDQLIHWCGYNFDGVIVFDEAHRAKNLRASGKKSTQTGLIVKFLQESLPKARIVYASATGASEPRNMAYMLRLGLWGDGTPFPNYSDFIDAVKKRGIGAMEMLAMDLKLRGLYIARQLSFKGVNFRIEEVPLTPEFIEMYDDSVKLWTEAYQNFEKAFSLLEYPGKERKLTKAIFWGSHQRYFKYLCISLKINRIVELAQESVAAGKCVVIGLQSTGEARLNEQRKVKELDEFVTTAKELLVSLIRKYFPVGFNADKFTNINNENSDEEDMNNDSVSSENSKSAENILKERNILNPDTISNALKTEFYSNTNYNEYDEDSKNNILLNNIKEEENCEFINQHSENIETSENIIPIIEEKKIKIEIKDETENLIPKIEKKSIKIEIKNETENTIPKIEKKEIEIDIKDETKLNVKRECPDTYGILYISPKKRRMTTSVDIGDTTTTELEDQLQVPDNSNSNFIFDSEISHIANETVDLTHENFTKFLSSTETIVLSDEEDSNAENSIELIENNNCKPTDNLFSLSMKDHQGQSTTDQVTHNTVEDSVKLCRAMKADLLKKIDILGKRLPLNTLDDLIDRLGGPKIVAEMTGRTGRMIRTEYDKKEYQLRKEEGQQSCNLKEKSCFMNGEKLIAIISDAASSGISLQSDKRVKNQKRRVHLTIELPWAADKAVQQFGRTHRANQCCPPEYVFLITELAGERRFASSVARRLESLGALTHGDRRAQENQDYSQFNVYSSYAFSALNELLQNVENYEFLDKTDKYARNKPFFFKNIFKAMSDIGLMRTEDQIEVGFNKPKNDMKRFLNRLLGMPVEIQQNCFQYFVVLIERNIDNAKKMGTYDLGILDLVATSDNVERLEHHKITKQYSTGEALTEFHRFKINRGIDWSDAYDMYSEASDQDENFYSSLKGFYLSDFNNGRRHVILALGNSKKIKNMITIYRPTTGRGTMSLIDLKNKYYKVSSEEAKQKWTVIYNMSSNWCHHKIFSLNCSNENECMIGKRHSFKWIISGSVLYMLAILFEIENKNISELDKTKSRKKFQLIRIKTTNSRIIGVDIPETIVAILMSRAMM